MVLEETKTSMYPMTNPMVLSAKRKKKHIMSDKNAFPKILGSGAPPFRKNVAEKCHWDRKVIIEACLPIRYMYGLLPAAFDLAHLVNSLLPLKSPQLGGNVLLRVPAAE